MENLLKLTGYGVSVVPTRYSGLMVANPEARTKLIEELCAKGYKIIDFAPAHVDVEGFAGGRYAGKTDDGRLTHWAEYDNYCRRCTTCKCISPKGGGVHHKRGCRHRMDDGATYEILYTLEGKRYRKHQLPILRSIAIYEPWPGADIAESQSSDFLAHP